jgi:uncharacterized protein YukE
MVDPLGVTPQELRGTSEQLNEVSTRMKDALSSMRAELAAEGAQWGGDSLGDQFANGDGGFVAQMNHVEESVAAKTGLLDYNAGLLKGAADSFQSQDEA